MSDIEELFLEPTKAKRSEIKKHFDSFGGVIDRQRLGRSLLGEDIDVYRFGEGKKKILIVGAHHASEHITASLLYYLLHKISSAKHRLFDLDLALYSSLFSLFCVPMLNPDGIELALTGGFENPLMQRQKQMAGEDGFLHWQANARGVDLNHNYDAGFLEYKEIEAKEDIRPGRSLFSGEYPESEPETRALSLLARSIDFSLVVSLHSQGEEIYAFGSRGEAGEEIRLSDFLCRELGYRKSVPLGSGKYGGFCDYTSAVLGIPSLTLEVGRGENPLPKDEYLRIKERLARALFMLPTRL